jgi:hypothetical protein
MTDDIIYGGSIDENRVSHLINAVPPKAKWSIGPEFDVTFYTPITNAELVSPYNATPDLEHPLEKD